MLLLLCAGTVAAQTVPVVRVKSDQTLVWRPGFFVPLTSVNAGTELVVVSRQGDWYEVRLPSTEIGFIAASQVELIGTIRPPETPGSPSPTRPEASAADSGWRGFGQLGLRWFSATQSYNAIFGQPGGLWFGGGAEFRAQRGWFVNGSVQGFHNTGERVFVLDEDISNLGVADTVTIVPIVFTGGYRWRHRRTATYLAGGIGSYFYKEHTEFDDPANLATEQFVSYHLVGGFEWRNTSWLSTAAEVEYAHVPNALTGGLSDAFNEHNLGGIEARVKFVFGK